MRDFTREHLVSSAAFAFRLSVYVGDLMLASTPLNFTVALQEHLLHVCAALVAADFVRNQPSADDGGCPIGGFKAWRESQGLPFPAAPVADALASLRDDELGLFATASSDEDSANDAEYRAVAWPYAHSHARVRSQALPLPVAVQRVALGCVFEPPIQ